MKEISQHYLDWEMTKGTKSLEYAQIVRDRELVGDLLGTIDAAEPDSAALWEVAQHMGFKESEAMAAVREEIKHEQSFDKVKQLLISYRTQAEAAIEAQKLSATNGSRAQIGMSLAMAALYAEHLDFEELAEFFDEELNNTEMYINSLD